MTAENETIGLEAEHEIPQIPEAATQIDNANPLEQVVEIEFWYFNNTRALKTDLSCKDYAKLLDTGLLDGKQISAVKIFTVSNDETGTATFLYSFAKKAQGDSPWVLTAAA